MIKKVIVHGRDGKEALVRWEITDIAVNVRALAIWSLDKEEEEENRRSLRKKNTTLTPKGESRTTGRCWREGSYESTMSYARLI